MSKALKGHYHFTGIFKKIINTLQCFDTVGCATETGCWFVGGEYLTGDLHVL